MQMRCYPGGENVEKEKRINGCTKKSGFGLGANECGCGRCSGCKTRLVSAFECSKVQSEHVVFEDCSDR